MNIGKTVKQLRLETGITQKQLADKTGLSGEYISMLENGHKSPTIKTIIKIAESFNTPAFVIVALSEENLKKHDLEKFFKRISDM